MSLSLMLLAQGFMNSDVNAVGSEKNDAQRDIRECQKDSDKHREPKELISIFDQTAKLYSEKGYTSTISYFEAAKNVLTPKVKQLNELVRTPQYRYRLHEKEEEARTKECLYAVKDSESKYMDYLKKALQGNEAIIEIVSKEEPRKYQGIGQIFDPSNASVMYKVKYIYKNKELIKTQSEEIYILESANPTLEFKAGDVVKIKRAVQQQGYPLVVHPKDIEKVAPYNPS